MKATQEEHFKLADNIAGGVVDFSLECKAGFDMDMLQSTIVFDNKEYNKHFLLEVITIAVYTLWKEKQNA